jgi:hypothetical protein
MTAQIGDRLIIYGHSIHWPVREGEIVEVRGGDGGPPYLVRWDDSDHETLLYPGTDARIQHTTAFGTAGPGALGAPARAEDGSASLSPDRAVALLREHIDLEKLRTADYDRELWELWREETARSTRTARVSDVLDRVLARVREGG